MKIVLLVLPCILAMSRAQQPGTCSNAENIRLVFAGYLQCVADDINGRFEEFEKEFQEDIVSAAQACFSPSLREAARQDRCVLSVRDLDLFAWGETGPLRECQFCLTFARTFVRHLRAMTESQRQCVRMTLADGIKREADACIRRRVPDFAGVPDMPDFEAGGANFREQILWSVSDHVWIRSRLAMCLKTHPFRAAQTERCLKSPPVPNYLEKHCALGDKCEELIPSDCVTPALDAGRANCQCIDEAMTVVRSRIQNIAQVIKDTIEARSRLMDRTLLESCVNNIKAQLITPVNDWFAVVNDAVTNCLGRSSGIGAPFGGVLTGQALDVTDLLTIGCRKVITDSAQGDFKAMRDVEIGFAFIENVADALIYRSKRFCGGMHCMNARNAPGGPFQRA